MENGGISLYFQYYSYILTCDIHIIYEYNYWCLSIQSIIGPLNNYFVIRLIQIWHLYNTILLYLTN